MSFDLATSIADKLGLTDVISSLLPKGPYAQSIIKDLATQESEQIDRIMHEQDTFFRFNTRHGLVLEARSVSLLPQSPIPLSAVLQLALREFAKLFGIAFSHYDYLPFVCLFNFDLLIVY